MLFTHRIGIRLKLSLLIRKCIMMKLNRIFAVYRGGKFGRIIPGGGPLGGTTIPGIIGGLGGIPCGAI